MPWQGLKHAISNANDPELRLIAALPELLRVARLQQSLPDKAGRPDIVAAHRFVVKARLGDETLDVGIVVREHRDGHRFYDHFIVGNKNPTGISEATTGANQQLGVQPAVGSAPILTQGGPALQSYTAEEVAAREVAQNQAEQQRVREERDAEQRAQADAERDSFTLTGSDRAADVAEARGQAPMFSRRDMAGQTETPEFKRWFGDSKVVDEDGRPLAMYHGTSANEDGQAFTMFDTFASNYGLMGQGGYFTADPEVASSYTSKGKGATPTVYKVYLSIKNPLDMDAEADAQAWQKQFPDAADFHEGGITNESWYRAAEEALRDQELPMWEGAEIMQEGLRAMGFDGITHVGGGRVQTHGVRHRVFIAFEPEQVKSAIGNNGDFDPANPDIRFSFAGQNASTVDKLSLASAQRRIEAGEDAEVVRRDTGWHQGADGKWRFEISDKLAHLKGAGIFGEVVMRRLAALEQAGVRQPGDPVRLGDVMYHGSLFAAYPSLKDIEVQFAPRGTTAKGRLAQDGSSTIIQVREDLPGDEALSVLLHEVQHGIQNIEGFASGGSPDAWMIGQLNPKTREAYERALDALPDDATEAEVKALARDVYRRLAGEVEARNTQARQALTDEQRRATPPSSTADVADADVIVTFNGKEMASAPPPANVTDDFDVQGLQQAMGEGDAAAEQAVAQAQARADAITAGWARKPDVQVVFDLSDPRVPAGVRSDAWAKKAQGASGEPAGFFYGGKVYLLASQLPTEAELRRVLFHEALGHYGLRALYGKALDGILQQIVEVRAKEVRSKAEQYGLDWSSREDRLVAAEEVLAEMAEKSPQLGFVRRAVAAMRSFLRQNVPGFKGLRVSDAEIIRDYLLPARGWVERGAREAADTEQRGRRPAFQPAFSWQEDAGRKALAEFSKADDLFALPKSDKDTVEGIAADNDPQIKVGKPKSVAGRVEYTLTMPDNSEATLSVRDPNPWGGEQVYDTIYSDEGMELVPGRPGENPEDVPPTGDVWINVSNLKTGDDGGAKVYNIAATYAHNTGRIFIGDPHGLSKVALRRRLEQMISSALKFGTTAHLAPHPDQTRGGHGVPPLRWVYGDDVGNVERMIAASVKGLDNAFPTSNKIAYDPDQGFYRTDTGRPLARGQLDIVLRRAASTHRVGHGAEGAGQAGWRTIARASLFRYLQSQSALGSTGVRERGSVLDLASAERARLRSDGSAGPIGSPEERKTRIFYARKPAGGVNPSGQTPPLSATSCPSCRTRCAS